MSNIYYNPEDYNLEIFCEIDHADDWDFDMEVVWKQRDAERYYYAADSGCSCPSPFEDFGGPETLEGICQKDAERRKKEWR
ncbi:hypothetical protein KAR91_86775 [Candidatus Pacearchaeota archaeon]|nr:hypothetical protein [Candidatus Pacearchaeota archaeon]